MPRPALLAYDLVRTLGTRRVLDGVSLTAAPGHRVGLIGENGVGKSTLLRLLAGVDEPDAGQVTRPYDLGFLHQEMPFAADATIARVLDDALREARADLAELDRLSRLLADTPEDRPAHAELLETYGQRLEQAQEREAWDADRRAAIVLDGLGLGGIAHDRTLGSLSGGQRGRLALAALLVRRPAALLLDEPTNHLDDEAAAFVEDRLRQLPGVVVVASHDRAFLDAVCTELIDLDPAVDGPVRFGGNYSAYQAAKRAERERWERRYAEEQEELEALRRSAGVTAHRVAPDRGRRDNEKMGYGHRAGRVQQQISRRVRNATRRLEELERTQVGEPPRPLRLHVGAVAVEAEETERTAETAELVDAPLVALRGACVPGRLHLDRLDIPSGDRLLVTGGNGAGKSTLLSLLAGRLHAEGEVHRRPGLSVGLLSQDTTFERPDRTARDTYTYVLGAERAEAVPLGSLGLLHAADLGKPVGQLSVGQRRRLALALLVARPPHLLLLDEPTNHLSPRLCDELEDALGAGPGTIVVASHDRWLRGRWNGRRLHLHSGRAHADESGEAQLRGRPLCR
ncbi:MULTISPECIES: ABC-F family ATP-binding cassette domain-containing protein [Streptomyces]|uniref:ABC-F family ATP-binding cassette domain-containing protein n=2 Tax=Streptomyces rimosus subsp. rimosus TaxID=132474 RepID=L8EWW8_STRR1|nr:MULTISPECIES: ABC-F family ATP-binding cassette domain-containing protein [Streptomyces]KOG77739.1 antibiotic ABC transporter ATP-binding protein [Kitasatospora aureofaciens]MYT47991.1 ATP-binding cassette domain-containing protein [Streptomyces sp. SID5471]KEF16871.1 antibiotic ABC transporter ATP-binding protein [Streptomyces rimosus]KOT40043.1 antibiotic ABC transporter ATP-binding protein [Streptomyces rimosus subsp. rimosus]KOT42949.1 antibiotic ABC transporter ATP-binding protein [Str